MEMHNPPHPGGILKEAIESLGMTVTDAANQIGISRVALSRVINEQAAISVELAIKLEDWYDVLGFRGGRAKIWLKMQVSYDLWQARASKAA